MLFKAFGRVITNAAAALMLFMSVPSFNISAAHAQDANTIVMKEFAFAPKTLTVKAGTTVTWKNMDGEPHTVVSLDGAFRSQALDEGDTFTFKFDKAGTYQYACSIHPRMMATIVVVP